MRGRPRAAVASIFPVLQYITDPTFYAVAIPAVLMLGVSKSGFGAGFGSLAVPIMALAIPVPQAAAIFLPLLLVMDLMGLYAFRRDVDWKLLRFLLPWGMLGVVIGAFLISRLPAHIVAGIVGAVTLLFLAQRLLFPPSANSPPPPTWLGKTMSTISGFTSFISHAGGPPLNAYLLPLKLPPLIYTGTVAYLFFFVNVGKWIPYAWLGLIDLKNMSTSLVLLPFAPIGVVVGVKIARRINQSLFYKFVYGGMFLTGCKLLWDGFAHAG